MKNIALMAAAGCALIASAASSYAVDVAQDDGQNFMVYGRLESAKSGCTVLMSKYVLDLHHAITSLPMQGSAITSMTPDEHIFIQLGGDNCDANEGYKNIGLRFVGAADDIEGSVLANTDTSESAATGIGIQLWDMNRTAIKPNVTIGRFPAAAVSNGNPTNLPASFPLNFSLVQLKNGAVSLGSVKTNLTVQIERL